VSDLHNDDDAVIAQLVIDVADRVAACLFAGLALAGVLTRSLWPVGAAGVIALLMTAGVARRWVAARRAAKPVAK
jgi:hypothetical protein